MFIVPEITDWFSLQQHSSIVLGAVWTQIEMIFLNYSERLVKMTKNTWLPFFADGYEIKSSFEIESMLDMMRQTLSFWHFFKISFGGEGEEEERKEK